MNDWIVLALVVAALLGLAVAVGRAVRRRRRARDYARACATIDRARARIERSSWGDRA